jgi:hypothetical protein
VRWVCCWWDVISLRRRTKCARAFSLVVRSTYSLTCLQDWQTLAWRVKQT